jgi:hypothetical protein
MFKIPVKDWLTAVVLLLPLNLFDVLLKQVYPGQVEFQEARP